MNHTYIAHIHKFHKYKSKLVSDVDYLQGVVTGLEIAGARYRLTLDNGETVTCKKVVIANGAYINLSNLLQASFFYDKALGKEFFGSSKIL